MTDQNKGPTVVVVGTGSTAIAVLAALAGQPDAIKDDRVLDEVLSIPDIAGPHGRAWKIDMERLKRTFAPDDATLEAWIIEARWAHPVWHSYVLFLIHLEPIAGRPLPVITREGARHQFFLYALPPDDDRQMAIDGEAIPALLTPVNFSAYLTADSDEDARAQIEAAVTDIVEGRLNPDTDALETWANRFGREMLR